MIITYIETVIRVILQLREWLIATGPCVLNKQHEALQYMYATHNDIGYRYRPN